MEKKLPHVSKLYYVFYLKKISHIPQYQINLHTIVFIATHMNSIMPFLTKIQTKQVLISILKPINPTTTSLKILVVELKILEIMSRSQRSTKFISKLNSNDRCIYMLSDPHSINMQNKRRKAHTRISI